MKFLSSRLPIVIALTSLSAWGVEDFSKRLAEWRPVEMHFDKSGLSGKQQEVVQTLVKACQYLEKIYWAQSDPQALGMLRKTADSNVKRMLLINGSRFDLLHDNQPFMGSEPFLPGRNIYPPGLSRADIEAYVVEHPEQKEAIYSPLNVVRGNKAKLETVPYHGAYREYLEPASRLLRKAADLTDDAAFAGYLRLRADALLSDDYYPSDSAWVDLKGPKIDLIFAPYETYLDDVLGVKGSWGAAVLIRNDPESAKLALYEKYVPAIQDALPLDSGDKPSKAGQPTPMEVVDAPFRSGDLRHGYQAVADNLPNDPRIHAEKGTKKIFFKNFMDARVTYVVLPLAKQVMRVDQANEASGDGYLAAVVLHEICHGLGPAYAHANGKQEDIRAAIGPTYAGLEEAKADVVGMYGLQWLMDHGALPKTRAEEYYSSYVAGIFRTVRYGIAEAHGRAEMMEFNFLSEQKAITFSEGRYAVDQAAIPAAMAKLAKELLEIEATGNRTRAEQWMAKYDQMPDQLRSTLQKIRNVPVDVDPHFDWPDM